MLGGKPGSAGSGVPGPRIGYMPQVIIIKTFRERIYAIYILTKKSCHCITTMNTFCFCFKGNCAVRRVYDTGNHAIFRYGKWNDAKTGG